MGRNHKKISIHELDFLLAQRQDEIAEICKMLYVKQFTPDPYPMVCTALLNERLALAQKEVGKILAEADRRHIP